MPDTIAAVSTGTGISAIGILRLSGPDAISAAARLFRPFSGISLERAEPRKLYYGELFSASGLLIDICLCTVSRAPESYTGENTAELQCHGSQIVLTEALKSLFACGVRQALPGEFTRRAFLNARLDLTQAEAVIDLIEAESPAFASVAAGQVKGAISAALDSLYSRLLDIIAHFHAVLDYPDEDIDDFQLANHVEVLKNADAELSRLCATYERGRILKDGAPAVIIGRPNTGKSSLLNALLGFDRAIVTPSAGTTRDTIEEKLRIGNLTLRAIDTAGLRCTDDEIERLGVKRTLDALRDARLAILVLDGSMPMSDEDFDAMRAIPDSIPVIAAVNKSDLPQALDLSTLTQAGFKICHVSAVAGTGLDALEHAISELFPALSEPPCANLITNARQFAAISHALLCVRNALNALRDSVTPDAALVDVEAALTAIGEVTGKVLRDDVISRIFERFCVGK